MNKKRTNKIFNNTYNQGNKLKGNDYNLNSSIQVENAYAGAYMKDIYDTDNAMQMNVVRDVIFELLDVNDEIKSIIGNNKKKFNKESINRIFKIIYEHFNADKQLKIFMNLIYIFDIVSNISGMKYKNLFDLLDYEFKQKIIVELDTQYNILKDYSHFNSMF